MTAVEVRTSSVSMVGRVADALTRSDLTPRRYRASLQNHRRRAIQKADGHFVFADLPAAPAGTPDHVIELTSDEFQRRRFTLPSTIGGFQELNTAGEDELPVIVTDITGNRVSFFPVPFVPVIPAGAEVIGEAGFATTLAESVEGVDVDGAELNTVAGGLAVGQALRIVRGRRLLLHPGPYYAFPLGTTVVALRVVEAPATGDPQTDRPVADAIIEIMRVDGVVVGSVIVDGVTLFRLDLPTAPATPFMLGTLESKGTVSNARGEALFCFASNTPATSLTVDVSRAGFTTASATLTVTAARRTSQVVPLTRV